MNRKGVNYDIGVYLGDWASRPVFDLTLIRRELEIIQNDLRCNAVRISGREIERLAQAAQIALELGLEVWLSPLLYDKSADETLAYILECAEQAEALRRQAPHLVFILGGELTLFMQGLLPGGSFMERIAAPTLFESLHSGRHNEPLNAFLTKANAAVRQVFHGEVSYAAVTFEEVDWTPFDYICLDHYRMAHDRDTYGAQLRRYGVYNKPLIIAEVGCCTYQGAENAGAMGWAIMENSEHAPPRLNGDYIRDEGLQARELTDLLTILDGEGVEGAFVFTFVSPTLVHLDLPRMDFDMASYSLVKSYVDQWGVTYPDMAWEPKESFRAVSRYFGKG